MSKFSLVNTLSQEEIDNIISLYQNNNSLRAISRKTGHSRAAITKMLEFLNVKTTQGNHYRYHFLNEDYFSTIDNHDKAYWLGFLYADGCIMTPKYGQQSVKFALAKKDLDGVEKFQQSLESTYPVRYDEGKSNSTNHQVMAIQELRSQKLVNDLKRLGCMERKSLVLQFPTEQQVPVEFVYSFIRGYFDGDGSISCWNNQYTISFTGTYGMIQGIYTHLQAGSVFPDKRKKNSWYLTINGNKQLIKMYHLLYANGTVWLNRKYDKFQELLNKYGEIQGV